MTKNFESLITLTKIQDGQNSSSFYIQTSQEELLWYIDGVEKKLENETLKIRIYKLPKTSEATPEKISLNQISLQKTDGVEIEDMKDLEFELEDNETCISCVINSTKIEGVSAIIVTFKEDSQDVTIKIMPVRAATTDELAQFHVNAQGINAAVRNSNLSFSSNGLEIYGSGFKIYKSKGDTNPTFYADKEGNLTITGTIYTDQGEIGGLKISEGIISSKNSKLIISKDGSIRADTIVLGQNAKIDGSLNIGTAKFQKPDSNDVIFSTGNKEIQIYQAGKIKVGTISLDGINSIISGNGFSITPDVAYFSNASISGTIETTVFKKGSVQSVGSTMIFRPAYKVLNLSIQDNSIVVLTTEGVFSGEEQNIVWLILFNGEYIKGKVTKKEVFGDESTSQLTVRALKNLSKDIKITQVIDLGESDNDYIFGINSSDSRVGDALLPMGLTLTKNSSSNQDLPSLFLGKLDKVDSRWSGFGLYSDNVYLNGSLTTRVNQNSYAGINTLSGAEATVFGTEEEDDTSKIVFWAGSNSDSAEHIKAAYFQVTEKGSVYAANAKLTNSLLVGGEIHSADIYTARIHGTGANADPSLIFYDTSGGISFRSDYQEEEMETCRITQSGVLFENQLQLDKTGIGRVLINDGNASKTGVNFSNTNEISFVFSNQEKIKLNETYSKFDGEVQIGNNLKFVERGYFSRVEGGLDLYIQEVGVNE